MKIVIIDYGAGNTKSVEFALNRIGCDVFVSHNPTEIIKADGVIFPGVGHAKPAMQRLKELGLDTVITSLKQPVLGICLGMQLMCTYTEEGDTNGLGIFDVSVKQFTRLVKVPQVGWNIISSLAKNGLLEGVKEGSFFYFVHSYYVPVGDYTISSSEYGGSFSAIMQNNNFYACQFHPEKSGEQGEQLLTNFKEICASYQQ